MVTQRRSLILASEKTAFLQFRNDEVDEVVERFREMGREKHKPVYRPVPKPFLHEIGNGGRASAGHQIASSYRDLIINVTQLVAQPLGLRGRDLLIGLSPVGRRQIGNRAIQRIL